MKKKLTLLIIIISIFFGLATPKVSQAACMPGIAVSGTGLSAQGFSVVDCVGVALTNVLVPVAGFAVKTSAQLFDFALDKNLKLGQFVNSVNPNALSPVETIWKIIRDLSGMFFIFILIYASIQTILNGSNAKNAIVGVVTGAVLVNFSLFFTKLVVDFSNTISLTIYSAIVPNGANTISDVIGSIIQIQTLFIASQNAAKSINFNVTLIITLFGAIALMVIISIMFLAGAVMFLYRFVILIGLMAMSPFWAISHAIPQLSEYGDTFLKKLIGQATFAPVFLFFIYIGLKVVTDVNFLTAIDPTNRKNLGSIFDTAAVDVMGPLFQYGVTIFIMFTGLGMAIKAGGTGGEFGIKWMQNLGKWGMGAISGAGSLVGRNTVGRAGRTLGESLDKTEAKYSQSKFGKLLTNNVLTRGTRSSFTSLEKSKYGGSSLEDVKKVRVSRDKEIQGTVREEKINEDVSLHLKSTLATSNEDLKKVLSKLNSKDLENFKDEIYNPKFASLLSSKQVESILKSDSISDTDKDKFKQARTDGIVARATEYKYSDIENIQKEDLSDVQKKDINDSRTTTLKNLMTSGSVADLEKAMKNMSGKELVKIYASTPYVPGTAIDNNFINNLKISHLKDMEGLPSDWRAAIGDAINRKVTHDAKGYVNKNNHIWL